MKAMVLRALADLQENPTPLVAAEVPRPVPGPGEVLLRVSTCGVCHTELDEIEGRTPPPRLPAILGHQVVGRVAATGPGSRRFRLGDRVGVGWIGGACGRCAFCANGQENLCPEFVATGRDADGGYAEYMAAREDFACPIPPAFADAEAAPLLCAGAIGWRSLRLTGIQDGQRLGLTGFGASASLLLPLVRHALPATAVYVFARDPGQRRLALELGAAWAGATADAPPARLHAIIDTTPAWTPVARALRHLEPGGRLVINAIRKIDADKEALLGLDYAADLWLERRICSVANVTRRDVSECLAAAAAAALRPRVTLYPLAAANTALMEIRRGGALGAQVLEVDA